MLSFIKKRNKNLQKAFGVLVVTYTLRRLFQKHDDKFDRRLEKYLCFRGQTLGQNVEKRARKTGTRFPYGCY